MMWDQRRWGWRIRVYIAGRVIGVTLVDLPLSMGLGPESQATVRFGKGQAEAFWHATASKYLEIIRSMATEA